MANINLSIPHRLHKDEALKRIKKLLSKTKEENANEITNLNEHWNDYVGEFNFTAKGFPISGTLTVCQSSVDLDGTIPFALSLFKGTIKEFITKEAKKLLK